MLVSIVYDSGYGHTKKQAEAAAKGVERVTGAKARLIAVGTDEISWDALAESDALIFGSATYNGTVSARLKQFMEDATRTAWTPMAWRNKVAAGFTNSGAQNGDKLNSLITMALFAAQHGMLWVGLDLFPGRGPNELNRLGSWLGAMAQSDDVSPDISPITSDLETAAYLGQRVAEQVSRLTPAA
ncbi:flavodoxin family protein [Pseudomonas sp. B2M1-30]|uniref:flavodoxin family protein n=1 Tax=Pseudomonas TaxID=286 RepID=UPI0021C87B58|nr:flavodoxin family protein [Pseudomonas botevensis]MCU0117437.1 flavodoxin family protein [Pseudomonas sp. B2M1-30]MCU7258973.1 flavodoxin family protein [Pseudomonas koreensis]